LALRRRESFSHDYRRSWTCRLQALEGYAAAPETAVRATLAGEAEKAAGALASLGDRPRATRAIALCRRLGRSPPSSRNPLLRLLKPCLPAFTLLRWQERWRRRVSASRPAS